jgi:hypothetical protein
MQTLKKELFLNVVLLHIFSICNEKKVVQNILKYYHLFQY